MRTIGASEGLWRIYGFKLHERWPKCMSLSIHLDNQQQIYFQDDDDVQPIVDHLPRLTHLTAFYKINEDNPDGYNTQIKFIDFPTYFVYNTSNRKWKQRSYQPSIKSESIGRLPLIGPNSGDVFYL